MKCLNCGKLMSNYLVQTKKDRLSYDVCESCGSFWLDAGELKKLAYQVSGDIEYCSEDKIKGVSAYSKKCPRCEKIVLDKVYFIGCRDIVLDRCNNCGGFWLDGGELDLINKELQQIMPIRGKGFSEFLNDVHLPYWYKKIRRRSNETDFKAETPPIKGAVKKSETQYLCPACSTILTLYEIYGIKIEGCTKCKGMWLDKNELRKLKDISEKNNWGTLRWLDDEVDAIEKSKAMLSKRKCPKCKDILLISTALGDSKIIIDWCPSCHGTWLDSNEFQELVDCLKKKLDKLSSSEMAKKVYEEIKEIWNGPENKISEILDAKAAITALINITIFEHPALAKLLLMLP